MAVLTLVLALAGGAAAVRLYARESPPGVPPPKGVSFRLPEVHQLPNGLRVVVIEQHDLPLLSLYAIVETGAEADPRELAGTAEMVADLLPEGTKRRSAFQIAEAIDQAGGNINTGAGWDESYANISVLSDQKKLAFDLLADMLVHPAFSPEEIERLRKQTLSGLNVVTQDPSYLADVILRRYLYSGTPYAHSEDGTRESIGRITRQDLVAFHARNYQPSRTILAVVGDISDQQCLELAARVLGEWKGDKAVRPPARIKFPQPRERQVVVIDKPDAVQTEIRVANLAVARSSSDYFALKVADQVLGGPAANRLFEALRTRQGLVYGAWSDLKCYASFGAWMAQTSTRSSESVRAVQIMLEQMKRLRTHPISGNELEMAQNYLVGNQALEFESPSQIANQVLEVLMYHLPLDFWNHYAEHIRSINTADVLSATQKYLSSDDDVIVMVGNVSAFKNDLKKLGSYRVIPIADVNQAFPRNQKGTAAYSNSSE
jgi:zinc protease